MILFLAALPFSAVFAQEIDDCIECHMDTKLTRTDAQGAVHSLYVDKKLFIRSVHGQMDYTCVDCHEGATADTHPKEGLPDVVCGECHEEALAAHNKTNHGKLLTEGSPDAPQCYDCHSMHEVLPPDDPQSSVHPENLVQTCGTCHTEESVASLVGLTKEFVQGKEGAAEKFSLATLFSPVATRLKGHGKVNLSYSYSTQNCGDCHFEVINHGNEELKPRICANCHDVKKSSLIFGKIHRSGVLTSPVLTVLMLLLYAAVVVGLVFYFKGVPGKKKEADQGE